VQQVIVALIDDEVQRPEELEPRAIKAYRTLPIEGHLPKSHAAVSAQHARRLKTFTRVNARRRSVSSIVRQQQRNARTPKLADTQSPAASREIHAPIHQPVPCHVFQPKATINGSKVPNWVPSWTFA
jgi:hypothetical protein